MSAISTFRTAVFAILDDAALARYTNAQVDAALTWALGQYSRARPVMRTYSFTGAGKYCTELPADFTAAQITGVTMDDGTDPPTRVPFHALYYDESWFLETTDRILSTSDTVNITYNTPHTIDGLNSASGTTIPADMEWLLELGAAGCAVLMRAVSRAETINMQPDVQAQLLEMSKALLDEFKAGIKPLSSAPAVLMLPDPNYQV